jgi:hypothetical protein
VNVHVEHSYKTGLLNDEHTMQNRNNIFEVVFEMKNKLKTISKGERAQ